MFYNIRTQNLSNNCPLDGYLENGTLVQGLDLANLDIKKACGILPVKIDSPIQPIGYHEDVSQRLVTVEDDGVIINRVYLPSPVVIPNTISARQIRLWLIENNISLNSIENAINSIVDENLRNKTLIEWEFAPYIERNHPLVNNLGQILGLSNEMIDQAFSEASQL